MSPDSKSCTATMPRLYTHCFLVSYLIFLAIVSTLTSAHSIEVPAGKKECFFEDLHVNDKVASAFHEVYPNSLLRFCSDDRNLSSRRGWSPRYRFLGKLGPLRTLHCPYTPAVARSIGGGTWQTYKTINWTSLDYGRGRW